MCGGGASARVWGVGAIGGEEEGSCDACQTPRRPTAPKRRPSRPAQFKAQLIIQLGMLLGMLREQLSLGRRAAHILRTAPHQQALIRRISNPNKTAVR